MEQEEKKLPRLLQELRDGLEGLRSALTRFFLAKWNRSLPFADLVFDRWTRAKQLGFGQGASIYDSSVVLGHVTVGEQTWVGPNTLLDGSGNLSIGSFCSISAGVQIYTHHTVRWALSGGTAPVDRAQTRIGDRVYIGPNAIIQMGVTIGDGAIIGAGSFVNKDIPASMKAWGTPAKIIGPAEI